MSGPGDSRRIVRDGVRGRVSERVRDQFRGWLRDMSGPLSGPIDFLRLRRHLYRYSESQIRQYQTREVLGLLSYARAHAPFYRERYDGMDVRSLEDFRTLPTIDKRTMMDHFDTLNTCGLQLADVMAHAVEKERNRDFLGYYRDAFVVGLSSGTSGNRGIYVTPKALTRRLPFVFLARSGIPLGLLPFRILFLLRVFSQGFADINAPFVHLKYQSTMTPVPEILEAIETGRINILMAPPSLIRLLLPHKDRIAKQVRLIVTYAEVLEVEEKQRFEQAFGARVIEIYQASEGQIGSACHCGRLHLNEDLVYVELLDADGNPVATPGTVANRMLVTNLVNRAQPLIRYEMNDLVVLGGPCPCGSRFRTIDRVLGRNDDVLWLRTAEGAWQHVFPDLVSRWIITSDENIREFQVLQERHDTLILRVALLADGPVARETTRRILVERFREEMARFGLAPALDIRFEDIGQPADKGKYKRFVRTMPAPE